MNLGEFRKLTQHLRDDTPLLVDDVTNTHSEAQAELTTALDDGVTWHEDFGEADTPEESFGERRSVVLIK